MVDGVVLVHAIFRTWRCMRPLADYLEKQGFLTLNVDYPSTRHSLEELADYVHPAIEQFVESVDGKVHFVGYSMGGLLIRAYLTRYGPEELGRVVMLGTPNGGSEVADFIQHWPVFRAVYGPAGQQLITKQEAFAHVLGEVDYPLGVIAGNKSWDPISSFLIGRESDGKVSVESTKVKGMTDHVVLPITHTFMPGNKPAQKLVERFLRKGCFS